MEESIGYRYLARAVINRVKEDIAGEFSDMTYIGSYRKHLCSITKTEAKLFVRSKYFETWCYLAELPVKKTRRACLEGEKNV